MMSRFALALTVCVWGWFPTFPNSDWLCAQEQPQPDKSEKPAPAVAEQPQPKVPEPKEIPESKKAEPDLSGFDRIDAYQKKWEQFNIFLRKVEEGLTDATPNLDDRPSPVVDETMRLMRVLDMRMLHEARQIYDQALQSPDPETRNGLLQRLVSLETITPLSDVTSRAENLLNSLTVDGKIYPTVEEARAAARKLKQDEAKKIGEISKQYQSELNDLKQELLTEDLVTEEKQLEEKDAREVLKTAVRLVVPQRRERLHELIKKYPGTPAAGEAQAILAAIDRRDEIIARRKLHEAVCARLIFDQRWRRLKELSREYPKTTAGMEAEQLFRQHALQVPSMTITNQTLNELEITVDVPYEKGTVAKLKSGEMRSFSSAFPMMVRVKIGENDWDVYTALAGLHYVLQVRHAQKPVLFPAPVEESLPTLPGDLVMPAPAMVVPTPAMP